MKEETDLKTMNQILHHPRILINNRLQRHPHPLHQPTQHIERHHQRRVKGFLHIAVLLPHLVQHESATDDVETFFVDREGVGEEGGAEGYCYACEALGGELEIGIGIEIENGEWGMAKREEEEKKKGFTLGDTSDATSRR